MILTTTPSVDDDNNPLAALALLRDNSTSTLMTTPIPALLRNDDNDNTHPHPQPPDG